MRSRLLSLNLVPVMAKFFPLKRASDRNKLWYITALIWLLSACASQPQSTALRDDNPPSQAPVAQAPASQAPTRQVPIPQQPVPQRNVLRDDDRVEPFGKAVNQASSAATIAQSAKTEAEWKAVADQWSQAIALMKTVPKNDQNYAIAQQKIAEYQKNLDEAQKKAKL